MFKRLLHRPFPHKKKGTEPAPSLNTPNLLSLTLRSPEGLQSKIAMRSTRRNGHSILKYPETTTNSRQLAVGRPSSSVGGWRLTVSRWRSTASRWHQTVGRPRLSLSGKEFFCPFRIPLQTAGRWTATQMNRRTKSEGVSPCLLVRSNPESHCSLHPSTAQHTPFAGLWSAA